ncbi:type II secretion system protein N [Mixta theicola]|nr:type II secretion system protein N [Mixta theicola]GLR08056.1 hypothetical protein GCM10007905_07750 [Mixta theicola]
MMLNSYNDYRYQLRKTINDEALAEQKLSVPTRVDNDLLLLQKSVSGMFKPQHRPSTLTEEQKKSQRYALSANNLTDDFYLSCPPAKVAARVIGLVSGDNKSKDIAVINYQGKEESYSVSDSLDGIINIVRIFPDRVIVNVRGYCAALLMD